MKIVSIFGTRPEFIKFSPLFPLLDRSFDHVMIHTGQHYSPSLDREIRDGIRIRKPDYILSGKGRDFASQAKANLSALEKILLLVKPDLALVLGDTNSTLWGAIAAARAGVPVAHVEAGCRSGNLFMPEEQNRLMVDSISTLHFAADPEALAHLKAEGKKSGVLVGSTGVDAVIRSRKFCEDKVLHKFGVSKERYALATIHRAENTENLDMLREKLDLIGHAASIMPVLFPVHPRTRGAISRFKLKVPKGVKIIAPQGYLEFLSLLKWCRVVLSDSGGIQEEAAVLRRPCLILRDETEWKRLVKAGRNFQVPRLDVQSKKTIKKLLSDDSFYLKARSRSAPFLTEGASKKILNILRAWRPE